VKVAGTTFVIIPKNRSNGQFKQAVNAALDSGNTTGVVVPRGSYL